MSRSYVSQRHPRTKWLLPSLRRYFEKHQAVDVIKNEDDVYETGWLPKRSVNGKPRCKYIGVELPEEFIKYAVLQTFIKIKDTYGNKAADEFRQSLIKKHNKDSQASEDTYYDYSLFLYTLVAMCYNDNAQDGLMDMSKSPRRGKALINVMRQLAHHSEAYMRDKIEEAVIESKRVNQNIQKVGSQLVDFLGDLFTQDYTMQHETQASLSAIERNIDQTTRAYLMEHPRFAQKHPDVAYEYPPYRKLDYQQSFYPQNEMTRTNVDQYRYVKKHNQHRIDMQQLGRLDCDTIKKNVVRRQKERRKTDF